MSSFYWFSLLPVKKTNKNYAQVAEGEGWTNYPAVGMVVISSVTTYVFRLCHDFLSAWGRHRKTGTIRIMCLSHLRLPFLQLGKGLLKLNVYIVISKGRKSKHPLVWNFPFLGTSGVWITSFCSVTEKYNSQIKPKTTWLSSPAVET